MEKIKMTLSMFIFGTIGLFVKYIDAPSSVIAAVRGLAGAVFLIIFCIITKKLPDMAAVRKNLPLLCISGAAIGINWILLFEAYNYTSVAVATLCYYMSPVFVILLSPLVLKEKYTAKKLICVAVALLGMLLVSGVMNGEFPSNPTGIILGLSAAAVYASIIFMNKKIAGVPAYDKTIIQLFCAFAAVTPYCLLTVSPSDINLSGKGIALLMTVGLVHTGIAYLLYFGSMSSLKSHTVAVLSYVDPAVAVILSAIVLHEDAGLPGYIGAILIIGATLFGELPERKKS